MKLSDDILNELTALSPLLAGMEKINVFTVPTGYFEGLDETILSGIKENDTVLLNSISKTIVFDTPQGYFENLPGNILDKIKATQSANDENELRALSPMLYSIQNENVFEVPVGYFNSIADTVLNKVNPQPAKVVPMRKRTPFFKYAAAAMITVVLSLGVFKSINKVTHANTAGQTTVASLDPSIQKGIKMDQNQFDQALNTLSEDDIANYLDKNGSDADVAELSSNIDDNSLPNQDEYLSNDSTLDNYLGNDNTNQKEK